MTTSFKNKPAIFWCAPITLSKIILSTCFAVLACLKYFAFIPYVAFKPLTDVASEKDEKRNETLLRIVE